MPSNSDSYILVSEFARMIHRNPQFVHMLIRAHGMPHKKDAEGRRVVNVAEAAAWLKTFLLKRKEPREVGPKTEAAAAFEQGTYLRWGRGSNRGYAYAIVIDSNRITTTLSTDYAAEPHIVATKRLRTEIERGLTHIVGRYEAFRFVANQLHRAHWLVTLTEFDDDEEILALLDRIRQHVLRLASS